MNYREFDTHAKSLGFQSSIDYKYLKWAVANDFPPPLHKLSKKEKDDVRADVSFLDYEISSNEEKEFKDNLEWSGVPAIYRECKGILTDRIESVPLRALNNFVLIADSIPFASEDTGYDPKGTGKTTELCAFIRASIQKKKLAHYVTSQDLQNGIETNGFRNDEPYFQWARNQEILCIDDVGLERVKFKVNHVEEVLNHRLNNGQKTVITVSCSYHDFVNNYPKLAKRHEMFSLALFKSRGG